jgi:hypothetical protein
MGTIPVCPEKNTDPPSGGRVRITPGVKRTKRMAGTIRSAGVNVNLKTKLMMTHDKRARTKAWNNTCIKSPEPGGRLSKSPGLKRAKRMVGTSTFGPVMSIIYINLHNLRPKVSTCERPGAGSKRPEMVLSPPVKLILFNTLLNSFDACNSGPQTSVCGTRV